MITNKETGEQTYVGAVLGTESSYRWETETFYAVVWDAAEKTVKRVSYAGVHDGGASYQSSTVTVDATLEVLEAFRVFELARVEAVEASRREREAKVVRKGDCVKVVAGYGPKTFKGDWRKVEGFVFWIGPNKFGRGFCVGVETADKQRVFTALPNVAKVTV